MWGHVAPVGGRYWRPPGQWTGPAAPPGWSHGGRRGRCPRGRRARAGCSPRLGWARSCTFSRPTGSSPSGSSRPLIRLALLRQSAGSTVPGPGCGGWPERCTVHLKGAPWGGVMLSLDKTHPRRSGALSRSTTQACSQRPTKAPGKLSRCDSTVECQESVATLDPGMWPTSYSPDTARSATGADAGGPAWILTCRYGLLRTCPDGPMLMTDQEDAGSYPADRTGEVKLKPISTPAHLTSVQPSYSHRDDQGHPWRLRACAPHPELSDCPHECPAANVRPDAWS